MNTDSHYMLMAIEASRQAVQRGDAPFGAVLVKDNVVLQVSGNTENSTHDPSAHAEVEVLRVAARRYGAAALVGSTVYASGEPCAMCSGTMFWFGVARVVIAATQHDIRSVLGGPQLTTPCQAILTSASPSVVVEGPLHREEAVAVLRLQTNQDDGRGS